MKQENKPTEVEKLKEIAKMKMILATTLVAFTAMSGINQFKEYNADKAEAVQMINDQASVPAIHQRIMKDAGDQAGTELYLLRSAVAEQRNELREGVEKVSELGKLLGRLDAKEQRIDQYQGMINAINNDLAKLEEQGIKPFGNLENRRLKVNAAVSIEPKIEVSEHTL